MKLIVGCDEHDLAPFLTILAQTVPLAGAEVLLVHVTNSAREEEWRRMAGHHWLGRHTASHRPEIVQAAETEAARAILDEALRLSQDWPAASRRAVDLQGNPERELTRLALSERADLLAVGQHRVELGPHAIGRCARFVIDHAPCSVVLVRPEPIRAAASTLPGHRLDGPGKEHQQP